MSKIDRRIKNFNKTSAFKGYNGDYMIRGAFSNFERELDNIRGQFKFAADMNKNRKNRELYIISAPVEERVWRK